MVDSMEDKKQTQSPAFYTGSVAIQVKEPFEDPLDEFSVFQKNLTHLRGKVSRLVFMMKEIQNVLTSSRKS